MSEKSDQRFLGLLAVSVLDVETHNEKGRQSVGEKGRNYPPSSEAVPLTRMLDTCKQLDGCLPYVI